MSTRKNTPKKPNGRQNAFARGFASAISSDPEPESKETPKERDPKSPLEDYENLLPPEKKEQLKDFDKKFREKLAKELAKPEKAARIFDRINTQIGLLSLAGIHPRMFPQGAPPQAIEDFIVNGILTESLNDLMDMNMTEEQMEFARAIRDNPERLDEIVAEARARGVKCPKFNF